MSLVIRNLRGAIVGPVDLVVERGTCAAISGPSGAGKSLFLRMIADLDQNEGDVRLGDLRRDAVDAPTWRRSVAYLAAETGWWVERAAAHVAAADLPDATTLAERLGVSAERMTRPVRTLSTGERQRLALVRALVRRPACLLLDEPTGALDPDSAGRVESLLREQQDAGTILILVTHDAAQASRFGSRRFTLVAGKLAPS